MTITIPQLKKPTLKNLKNHYPWIKSIESDTSPTSEVSLELLNLVPEGGDYIKGEEYTKRREGLPLLGYQHAKWLVEHQDEPELAVFKAFCGKVYIDFPGLIVVDADGYRSFTSLCGRGGRWCLRWSRVGYGLCRNGRVASSSRKQEAQTLEPELFDTQRSEDKFIESEIKKIEARAKAEIWEKVNKSLCPFRTEVRDPICRSGAEHYHREIVDRLNSP